MLRKVQIEMEPHKLSGEEWTEWFLNHERANVLGILIKSYGARFGQEDIEDIVQEASLVVWEKIMKTDDASRSREGMKRFMILTCRYMLSHEIRRMEDEERLDTWTDESRWEKVGEMLNRDDDMDRVRRIRYEKLIDTWDKLKPADQLLLTKYYWENKSMVDIAIEMKLKNDKVAKNYKGRIMKILKEMIRLKQTEG